MKILHLYHSLNPEHGGPPMVVVRLAAAQAAAGMDVHLTAQHSPGDPTVLEQSAGQVLCAEQLQFVPVPPQVGVNRVFDRASRRRFCELLGGIGFLHLHGVWHPLIAAGAAAAGRTGTPYAVVPHGTLDPWCLRYRWLKKRIALALSRRQLLNRAAFIHALTNAERDMLRLLGLTAPIEVIPNGVSVEEFESLPDQGEFYAAHPELNGKPYVLFLGRLHFIKGIDHLVRAVIRLSRVRPDVHLVVAGPDGGAGQALKQQVAHAGAGERVHFVGPVHGRAKLAALHDAAVLCMPSRYESFGIAIAEAMAAGRPVVISESCNLREIAEAGAGLVVPLDADRIAEALQRVLDDPQRAAAMGAAGAALVRDRYTWPKVAAQSIALYERYGAGRSRSLGPQAART